MKKILATLAALALAATLTGCNGRDAAYFGGNGAANENDIKFFDWDYANTSDSIVIKFYNGFRVSDYEAVETGEDSYTITINASRSPDAVSAK